MGETVSGQYWPTPPDQSLNNIIPIQVDKYGRLLTVASEPVGGGVTWGAPTAVASNGASKTLIAANAARKAIRIWNPVGNAQMSYDIAGGTVTLAAGTPLLAGAVDWFTGADCPVGLVTFIGTNLQNLVYQEGT